MARSESSISRTDYLLRQVSHALGFEQDCRTFRGTVTFTGTLRVTVRGTQRVTLYSTCRGTRLGRVTILV